MQGIIDVYFEEADGIVILDYKTDRVQSMEELWNRYETQLDYYGQAVARLSGKPVKEKNNLFVCRNWKRHPTYHKKKPPFAGQNKSDERGIFVR